MSRQLQRRNTLIALGTTVCALAVAGCASWQGPRIDPSGERLLIWPNEPPPVVLGPAPPAPAIGAPTLGPPVVPPPAATIAPQFLGNVEAPPVYPDAGPAPPPPSFVPATPALPVQPPTPVPMLPNPAAPVVITPVTAALPIGQAYLRITPDRVLAPVGSEVVLKAGVCAADGYLRTDRQVQWQLARSGVGQFANLGGRDQFDLFRWYWETPRMIDGWSAIGVTGYDRVVIQRGNLDPSDDVVVEPGEAWISLMSACEGTSQVTAYSPDVDSQFRQAIATIFWVDVQWAFPPSAVAPAGRPHVLTTSVIRRTDGLPLAGWIVRYAVSGGGASLGYEAGSSVEVPTDANGRASIEVSPISGDVGTTNVMMTLIRPAMGGAAAGPPLEIGHGIATITWNGPVTAAPVGPDSVAPIIPAPPNGLAPTVPPGTPSIREPAPIDSTVPDAYTPPRDEPPAGQPQLDLTINRVGPEDVEVNQFVRFDVSVANRGNGTARGILVKAQFDPGLAHPGAKPGEYEVQYRHMGNIPPGQSESIALTYQVLAAGRQCHRVTVTADGGAQAFSEACVTGCDAAPAAEPVLNVRKIGPPRQYVGERAKFRIVISNTGTVPVTNIEIVDRYDPAFNPVGTSVDAERGADGSLIWKVAELPAGQRRSIEVSCECVAASDSACNNLLVTADGGINQADQVCVEILAQLRQNGATSVQPPAAPTAALRPLIAITTNPVNEGEQTTILITVENTQQQAIPQVQLRVALPPEMAADTARIEPRGESVVIGQEVRFNKMDFAPGRTEFKITVTANQPGQVRIKARLEGDSLTQPIDVTSNVVEILTPSL